MRLSRVGAASLLLASCAACVPQNLAFRVDTRVSITSPKQRSEVVSPVAVSWTVRDFRVVSPGTDPSKGAGYFAVFLDKSPMPPGKDLAWLARDDSNCDATAGCPDAKYLKSLGVYVTTSTSVALDVPASPDGDKERHTATLVLLDGSGARIGESAFDVQFTTTGDSS